MSAEQKKSPDRLSFRERSARRQRAKIIAKKALVDPRTVLKELDGSPLRGKRGIRIRTALGLPVPAKERALEMILAIQVEARVSEPTVRKYLAGKPIRGDAGDRLEESLAKLGLAELIQGSQALK